MGNAYSEMTLPPTNPHRKKAFHLYPHSIVSVLVIIAAWFNSPASHQPTLQSARHHVGLIASLLHADPRFQQIEVLPLTHQYQPIHVFGDVASKDDAEILRILVASTKPPVRTEFAIFVHANGITPSEALRLPDLLPSNL